MYAVARGLLILIATTLIGLGSVAAYWFGMAVFGLTVAMDPNVCEALCEMSVDGRATAAADFYFAHALILLPICILPLFIVPFVAGERAQTPVVTIACSGAVVGGAIGWLVALFPNILQRIMIGALGTLDWEIAHTFDLLSYIVACLTFSASGAGGAAVLAYLTIRTRR
jgi:hypothetical protein